MLKAIFKWALVCVLLLAAVYWVFSSIPKHKIDKSIDIIAPQSVKSRPEVYGFGYQPSWAYSEARAECAKRYPLKRAFFGDLHIHTALSADAFPDGTRTFPADAYRFAKGEQISLPTPEGQPQRYSKLRRPLDFAAVTDHAETFGEGYVCRTRGAFPGYESNACKTFRAGGERAVRLFMTQNAYLNPTRKPQVCGEALQACEAADKRVWQQVIDAAEQAYDKTSACSFTSFVGYEYTRSPNAMHMHRNTIFKNASVPGKPATFFSHPSTHELLTALEQECRVGIEECDVLSIPHNSNLSAGNAFNPREMEGFSLTAQRNLAKLRNAFDRLMEITQHKGTSECLNQVTDILGDVDELCDVEALRQFGKQERAVELNNYLPKIAYTNSPECSADNFNPNSNLYGDFCLSSRDFARGALLEGMQHAKTHAANPYQFGFIGSSDTHIGLAGGVEEQSWPGHIAYETDLEGRLGQADIGRFNRLVSNPGGLAGVYANENSRDALFHAMKRRETFATSGPRIEPRFFIGRFPEALCDQADWLEQAYRLGAPMGAVLPTQSEAFNFLLQAKSDTFSNPLDKLQLIKGWVDSTGKKHTKVVDAIIADKPESGDELCVVLADQDYDPATDTYYYLRAVEKLSLRWSEAQCQSLPADLATEACNHNQPRQINEMAWSSPIWLTKEP